MNSVQRIAVTGATGRVGRHLVELLENSGYEVARISRSNGVDVVTGEGLEAALSNVDTVVDTATGASPDRTAATDFFVASAMNVLATGRRTGVRRLVGVSIIGCDRFSGDEGSGGGFGGYYAAKAAQERVLLDGPLPVRILRAAQFHEFVEQLLEWTTQGDTARVPAMNTQLVAARSVAEALVELATGPADGTPGDSAVHEIAGPRPERLADAARLLVSRHGLPQRVEEAENPNDPDGDLLAGDALLPGPHAQLAGPTYEDWLNSQQAA